jgi:GcrA cell cycle regulator
MKSTFGEEVALVGWTNEKIGRLKKLWSQGLTTAAIGVQLKISKNAVVGKVHRLALKARQSPIKPQNKPTEIKKIPKVGAIVRKTPRIFTLAELSSQTCRWPFGDPKHEDFGFCGQVVTQGKSYCAKHCDLAYVGSAKIQVK